MIRPTRTAAVLLATGLATGLAAGLTVTAAGDAAAQPAGSRSGAAHRPAHAHHGLRRLLCSPDALPLSYSDALNKVVYDGVKLGGLSSLAYDRRTGDYVAAVDNHGSDPARIWFFRRLAHPAVVRDPLVLKNADGTPYDGTTSDNEGLAVLPDGDFLVSSETEPSIRIYDRSGVQQASLPIPARFAVTGTTPDGQATSNATLEGLTITPDGHEIVAAMEGALSGDVSSTGDATFHRFLVYSQAADGTWALRKQVGYRTSLDPDDPAVAERIPEIAAVSDDRLIVEEAQFDAATGNNVYLYEVSGLRRAPDVSGVENLSTQPDDVLAKKLIANLVTCPTLGATALETQANPLLDNFEGMAITSRLGRFATVSLISDDNFSATQRTRLLNLAVDLGR